MIKDTRRALLAALLLATAACGGDDGPTEPRIDRTGTVAFRYDGFFTGTFAAEGALVLQGSAPVEDGSWAGAVINQGRLNVVAFNERANRRADYLNIILPGTAPGVYEITEECVTSGDDGCPSFVFALNGSIDTEDELDALCGISTGRVELTHRDARRARGTFSGTLYCIRADGSGEGEDVALTGGTFDVALFDLPRGQS